MQPYRVIEGGAWDFPASPQEEKTKSLEQTLEVMKTEVDWLMTEVTKLVYGMKLIRQRQEEMMVTLVRLSAERSTRGQE